MKNLFKIYFAVALLVSAFFIFPSFTASDFEGNTNSSINSADNSCIVYVKTSYGSAAKSVKVSTDVSGGISCIGGRSFYTDSDGKVILEWSSGCSLKKIYVDGRGNEVDYRDGGKYEITMK